MGLMASRHVPRSFSFTNSPYETRAGASVRTGHGGSPLRYFFCNIFSIW